MTDIQTWLDNSRALAAQATQGPWFTSPFEQDPVWGSVVTGGVDDHDEDCPPCIEGGTRKDAEFIADARTRLPLALDALQAVLDLHHDNGDGLCNECSDGFLANDPRPTVASHPCPTVRAIQTALGTEA